jgi:hypothetical protein
MDSIPDDEMDLVITAKSGKIDKIYKEIDKFMKG